MSVNQEGGREDEAQRHQAEERGDTDVQRIVLVERSCCSPTGSNRSENPHEG